MDNSPEEERGIPRAELDLETLVSVSLIRLRTHAGIFGVLALFAPVQFREDIATAATDGRSLFWNPNFFRRLKPVEVNEIMLHQVLHAALLHGARRGVRDTQLWSGACDSVVNNIIHSFKVTVAENYRARGSGTVGTFKPFLALEEGIRDEEQELATVEEIYEGMVARPPLFGASNSGDLWESQESEANIAAYWCYAWDRALTTQQGGQWQKKEYAASEKRCVLQFLEGTTVPAVESDPAFRQAVLSGDGQGLVFPADPIARWALVEQVAAEVTDATSVENSLLWMLENAPLEWGTLFYTLLCSVLRPRQEMRLLADAYRRNERIHEFMWGTYAKLMAQF